ncbi:nucleotidyltransferase domain-containing protein [Oceanobacillus sp. CAU 1775]
MADINLPHRFLKSLLSYCPTNSDIEKVILYGSRARGDFKINSDIDLAIYTVPLSHSEQNLIENTIQEIPTYLKVDVVFMDRRLKKEMIKNIKKDGVTLYEQKEALRWD